MILSILCDVVFIINYNKTMDKEIVKSNGNVYYIDDPNNVNINSINGDYQINGIPKYEDMFISAELTAVRKGRSVLVSTNENQYTSSVKVNFIGNNQNENNPNYLNFTTNYYDGSFNDNDNFESFGISNINIKVNSSFVPEIEIQFIDVRGVSFFNNENSPYLMLFDFPPPIFNLRIKGYYGKTLNYRIHLVSYTTDFKSENGNFIVDAKFIAMTYAPLTDVLFRYIINFPLMGDSDRNGSPLNSALPTNTNDLIIKLKNLYSAIGEKIKTDEKSQQYDNELKKLSNGNDIVRLINQYKSELSNRFGRPLLMIKTYKGGESKSGYNNFNPIWFNKYPESTTASGDYNIEIINNVNRYDELIIATGIDDINEDVTDRLVIGYVASTNNIINEGGTVENRIELINNELDTFGVTLLNKIKKIGTTNQFSDISIDESNTFECNYDANRNINTDSGVTYCYIDITDLYLKLYKDKSKINNNIYSLTEDINNKINNMIVGELGMKPTIYNIFKIILDDVDYFFEKIRKVSIEAESNHHVNYRNEIIGNIKDDTEKIYSFPLIINKNRVTGGYTEERIAPIELSNSLSEPFPEMKLVYDFINTFSSQVRREYLANMKSELNSDGTYNWIPISPLDSVLCDSDVKSPYYSVDSSDGSNINVSSDSKLNQILSILIKRFYILTQNTFGYEFYLDNLSNKVKNEYIKLYAKSESLNLSTSISQSDYSDNIKTIANTWKDNISGFFDYVENNLPNLYNFSGVESFNINDSGTIQAYVDRTNDNYIGVNIVDESMVVRDYDSDSTNPIDVFQSNVKENSWKKYFIPRRPESFYGFTNENVLYLRDAFVKSDGEINNRKTENVGGVQTETRFILKQRKIINTGVRNDGSSYIRFSNSKGSSFEKNDIIEHLLNNGNSGFSDYNAYPNSDSESMKFFGNVIDTWVELLSTKTRVVNDVDVYMDEELVNIMTGSTKLSSLIQLSNFGYIQSPFNVYYNDLNRLIFKNPAAIDVPVFIPLYIGAIIDAIDNDWINEIRDFFINEGKYIPNSGLFIFGDIFDADNTLSKNDRDLFKSYYNRWYENDYGSISIDFGNIYNNAQSLFGDGSGDSKEKIYKSLFNLTKSELTEQSIKQLLKRTTIINYSNMTFNISLDETLTEYVPMSETNILNGLNESYFKILFNDLGRNIETKENNKKDKEESERKISSDPDIINQTYYSFKNINDKWITNPINNNQYGYPFNDKNKKLIDSFAFVDRAMNPIGDTIINPESLIDMFNNHNISVFSVLSQLLSQNGFEFFPLQNFMVHDFSSWEDSFKIDTNTEAESRSAFVCMYIGGSSSYPSNINNGFIPDSVNNFQDGEELPDDFKTSNNGIINVDDDSQVALDSDNNSVGGYRNIRAFRVKFGEQNQSMFKDIKIDSKEYPETNESIQILSRLAGDNKIQSPIPKGQNLYNLYENRAYRANVVGLGNAMIQPTQYFQLDNIPVFNGIYMILDVNHNITPNKMITSFSGTKILKFPVPRVNNPAAIFGFEGGSSSNTSTSSISSSDVLYGSGSIYNPDNAKYNSMYTFTL